MIWFLSFSTLITMLKTLAFLLTSTQTKLVPVSGPLHLPFLSTWDFLPPDVLHGCLLLLICLKSMLAIQRGLHNHPQLKLPSLVTFYKLSCFTVSISLSTQSTFFMCLHVWYLHSSVAMLSLDHCCVTKV